MIIIHHYYKLLCFIKINQALIIKSILLNILIFLTTLWWNFILFTHIIIMCVKFIFTLINVLNILSMINNTTFKLHFKSRRFLKQKNQN